MKKDHLSSDKEFNMLSLLDLLEARDHYHLHLMNKKNVVATAVGRYLIRSEDPWPKGYKDESGKIKGEKKWDKAPRTLENSQVRQYSWPCILVFVDKWIEADKFGEGDKYQASANDMVPKALFMPDGRVVPVCVVKASLEEKASGAVEDVAFADNMIGGGYPVIADVQNEQHIASIGCMLTDGHRVYALTNRHVAGDPGETVYSVLDGQFIEIGKSSQKQLGRKLFQEVYTGWPGKNVYVNLDIGLIDVADRGLWTAQIYSIGQMGKLADLSINNISLKLIDCPVRAYGCASKEMIGQVYALFYRYKSVGGFEYIADFLIGARKEKLGSDEARKGSKQNIDHLEKGSREIETADGKQKIYPFSTSHGDSGTVWLLETGDPHAGMMPLAIQWGGHVFVGGTDARTASTSYALATCLSTVCNLLEVDVVRDWNIGHPEYWGEMGHYTIGAKACNLVKNPKLRKLMTANLRRIGFDDGILKTNKFKHKSDPDPLHPAFVPLADVADNVWRPDRDGKEPDKKPFSRREDENNHFADMDQEGKDDFAGQTLLSLCENPDNVDPEIWKRFYDTLPGRTNPGALPFRVWQIYNEMVAFVRNEDVASFVCAAGLLAHYVGDACQPLHISHLHHGDVKSTDSKDVKKKKGDVHAVYETRMLDKFKAQGLKAGDPGIVELLNIELADKKASADVSGGHEAAVSVVELMRQTVTTLPPKDIVKAFPLDKTPSQQADALWKKFNAQTITCIAMGCLRLASLWESAWKEGQGNSIDAAKLVEIPEKKLQSLYQDRAFLKSVSIKEYKDILE